MFMDERTDVDKDKPPALMIAYAPAKGSTRNGEIVRSNEEVIVSCLQRNGSKNTKGYEEAVDCIDKNLTDKVGIFRDRETSQKGFCSQTQIQKGLCSQICIFLITIYLAFDRQETSLNLELTLMKCFRKIQ